MGHVTRHKTVGYWKDVEVSNHDQFQSSTDLREVNAYWIQTAKTGVQKWDLVTPTGCEA